MKHFDVTAHFHVAALSTEEAERWANANIVFLFDPSELLEQPTLTAVLVEELEELENESHS